MSPLLLLLVLFGARAGDVTITLPSTDQEVVFDDSAAAEVEAAMAALAARRFEEAGRRFAALADASGNADLRYLEALARYEGGEVRLAERAARLGAERAPDHVPLASLYGLVLADLGRGDAAIAVLDAALPKATDDGLRAGIVLNRGLVRLDRGEADLAEADFRQARTLAGSAGLDALVTRADENLGLVEALRGRPGATDPLGVVSEKLRKGDLEAARAAVPKAAAGDRRARVRALLAEGNVARAEGRLDVAAQKLDEALAASREGGLTREAAAALGYLGVVYSAAGRYELALDRLQEAIGTVSGTSFRVNELAYRVEAGRVAVRLDDLDQARAQLAAAKRSSQGVQDPLGLARLAELEGLIAARSGEVGPAAAAFDRAIAEFEKRQYWAEAARVATEAVELYAGRDEAALAKAHVRAARFFASAGDPLGPAHAGVAEGLGRARRDDLDGALKAFTTAAAAAEKLQTARGRQVAGIARENAAQALVGLGHTQEALDKAGEYGLEEAVKRQERFAAAERAYDEALAAWDAGRFEVSRVGFEQAWKTFEGLGESGYALKARRGRAWSMFNLTVGQEPAAALPVWERLSEEALFVRDPELRARSVVAAALAASTLKRPEAVKSLRAAADIAEQLGLPDLAGQCFAELAAGEADLDARVHAARRAFELRHQDEIGAWAMYSASVDAYNEERYELAVQLAEEVLPAAGSLDGSVRQVLQAAREALSGG